MNYGLNGPEWLLSGENDDSKGEFMFLNRFTFSHSEN